MPNLTLKQEAFVMAYAETGNASEAYRRAYNAEKMKPESINRKAKELMDNVKITARVAELAEATASARIATAAERQELLTTILRDGDASSRDRMRAIEILGRAQGDFIDKLHVSGELNTVIVRDFTSGGVS